MIISVEWATDPAFTQNVSGGNQTCPATNVICWTSFRPNHIWKGRYYWKVKIAGADEPAERDVDVHRRRAASADRPDPPLRADVVRKREAGSRAYFSAQVRDNKGEVRMRALLTYRGLPVLEGWTPFAPSPGG